MENIRSFFKYKPASERSSKWTVTLVFVFVLIYFFYLIFQLYTVTVSDYDVHARDMSSDQWKLMTYTSDRGIIYDSKNNQLASNTYDFTVVCTPNMVVSKLDNFGRSDIIRGFVDILGVTVEKMESILPMDPKDKNDERNKVLGVDVIKNVPTETKEQFEKFLKDNKIKGVSFVAVPQRYYNYGSLCSQVIGFANNDGESLKGIYGLEAYYNSVLSGTKGYRYSEVDAGSYGVLPYAEATNEKAVDGKNLVLNIDVSIQRIAEEACKRAYDKFQPRDGVTAIVMDPYTGAIYAMVSLPDFDLNKPYELPFAEDEVPTGVDPEEWELMSDKDKAAKRLNMVMDRWRNRCVSDTYEPGSTFKSLTTAMALEENLTNEDEEFSDAPLKLSDQYTISCWKQKSSSGGNHGVEPLYKAFQNSCNPVFAQLAYRIGIEKYYSYVRMLGFYNTTGIDLPAEGKGVFHSSPSSVDMAVLSYGESATVTPIQLIMSYCALINGGDLLVPHVVKSITDSEGNIVDQIDTEVVRTVFSENTCSKVKSLMERVVTDGTGSAGRVPGYKVAGKTSTSTIEVGKDKGAHVLSFSCYAPCDNPKIAVLVVLNKPKENSVGSSNAAATAAEIVSGTLTYLGIERKFSPEEYEDMMKEFYVQDVRNRTASEATSKIAVNGITAIYGTADMKPDTPIAFTYPDYTKTLYAGGIVLLYPDGTTNDMMQKSRVPNMEGMSAIECVEALKSNNLNCKIKGDVKGVCSGQSESAGTMVLSGEIIEVTMSDQVIPKPKSDKEPGSDIPGGEDGEVVDEDGVKVTEGDGSESSESSKKNSEE